MGISVFLVIFFIPFRVCLALESICYTLYGIKMSANKQISQKVKQKRKALNLTQQEFAFRSGVGLRFVRDLEQGKESVRLDKVNQVLEYLGLELTVKERPRKYESKKPADIL